MYIFRTSPIFLAFFCEKIVFEGRDLNPSSLNTCHFCRNRVFRGYGLMWRIRFRTHISEIHEAP